MIWNKECITLKYSKMMLVIVTSPNGNLWIMGHSLDLTIIIITLNKNISNTTPQWIRRLIKYRHMLICLKNNGKHKLHLYTHSTEYIQSICWSWIDLWALQLLIEATMLHWRKKKQLHSIWRIHHSYDWLGIHPWAFSRGLRVRRECPPRVSDPDMHQGTCVTHVPWCRIAN